MATPQETPIDTNSAFQAIQENITNSSIGWPIIIYFK